MKRLFYYLLPILLLVLSGTILAQDDEVVRSAFTYHRPDGNRFVDGSGQFPNVQVQDFPLHGSPIWLVGSQKMQYELSLSELFWVVVLDDGGMEQFGFRENGQLSAMSGFFSIGNEPFPATPPVLTITDGRTFLEARRITDSSPLTHPVTVGDRTLYVALNGDIVVLDSQDVEITRLPEHALPDARIVVNEIGLAAVYTGATNERYVHGIMGDDIEAASLVVIDPSAEQVIARLDLPGQEVFEGLAPMWTDVDEDGSDDLITTVSFPGGGAQLRAYTVEGDLLASSPAIGSSNRWRHQLAWGPFGASGENLLVEVLTPHIGGVVGFFAYQDGELVQVGQVSGYTSHVIGSRNLDMAVAGDFDGDGQPEIVLPDQQRGRIAGLVLNGNDGVSEAWTLPLDGVLVTNLSTITLSDGGLGLAAGVANGNEYHLRVWLPVTERR